MRKIVNNIKILGIMAGEFIAYGFSLVHDFFEKTAETVKKKIPSVFGIVKKPVIWLSVITISFLYWLYFKQPEYNKVPWSFDMFLTMLYEEQNTTARIFTQNDKDITDSFKEKYRELYEKGNHKAIYDAVADGYIITYSSHKNYYYYAYLSPRS